MQNYRIQERKRLTPHLLPSLGLLPLLCLDQLKRPQIWSLTTVLHFCEEGKGVLYLIKDSAHVLFPGVCPPGFHDLQFCIKVFLGRKMLEFMLHTNVSYCSSMWQEKIITRIKLKLHSVTFAHILLIRTGLCDHPQMQRRVSNFWAQCCPQ